MDSNERITYITQKILNSKKDENILLKLWNWWKPMRNDIVFDSASNTEAIISYVYNNGRYIDICRARTGTILERVKTQIFILPTENQLRNFVEDSGNCIIKSVPSKSFRGDWFYHISLIPRDGGSVRDYKNIQSTSYLLTLWEVACKLVKDMEEEEQKKSMSHQNNFLK